MTAAWTPTKPTEMINAQPKGWALPAQMR